MVLQKYSKLAKRAKTLLLLANFAFSKQDLPEAAIKYKMSRKQFISRRKKGPQHLIQVVIWIIYLYYTFIDRVTNKMLSNGMKGMGWF